MFVAVFLGMLVVDNSKKPAQFLICKDVGDKAFAFRFLCPDLIAVNWYVETVKILCKVRQHYFFLMNSPVGQFRITINKCFRQVL